MKTRFDNEAILNQAFNNWHTPYAKMADIIFFCLYSN